MRVALVLGGGGLKGLAHVGAWRAIQEIGLPLERIVGTSIGAMVGATIAAGQGWEEMQARALALTKPDIVTVNRWAVLLNGIRQSSVFRGDVLRDYIGSVLPVDEFGDLELPLSVNAVDLGRGSVEWFGAGGRRDVPLADAVYGSCALPVFYPPLELEGRVLVDGGVLDPLPIEHAASLGAELIVAVDVGSGPDCDAPQVLSQGMIAIQHRVSSMQAQLRKRRMLEEWSGPPLLYVRPRLDGYGTFDFDGTSYFLEEGYEATRTALASLAHRFPQLTIPLRPRSAAG
jgi:NTE family protein